MAEDGAFNRIDILSNENATYWNRGALVVHGGVGIKNDLYIGGKANILGNTNISGNATINNLEVGNLTFTGTNDFKIKTDLISDGVDLSIGNQTNRFHGYFNEINSNIINNNSKITSSHIQVANKLEVCSGNLKSLKAIPERVTIYGDSFTINSKTYHKNTVYFNSNIVQKNHLLIEPELLDTSNLDDTVPYETTSSILILSLTHNGTKTLRLDSLDLPNYCTIRVACIYKATTANLNFVAGSKTYEFKTDTDCIEVILISGAFFKIGGNLTV